MRLVARVPPCSSLLLAPAAAQADERILAFERHPDPARTARSTSPRRSMSMPRTIRSTTASTAISRPATRPDGGRMRVGFTFEAQRWTASPVNASARPIGNGVRIKIGDPDPSSGPASTTMSSAIARRGRSAVSRLRRALLERDRHGWAFPIDVAEARIRLPSPVEFGQRPSTPAPRARPCQTPKSSRETRRYSFRTTGPLDPYEG